MSKIRRIEEDALIFDNGYKLESYHPQDCCESHWLDFSVMEHYNIGSKTGEIINIYEQDFDFKHQIPFKRIKDMGIVLIDTQGNRYLVNGYGENNGYYNDNIILKYKSPYNIIKFQEDVSECQQKKWY